MEISIMAVPVPQCYLLLLMYRSAMYCMQTEIVNKLSVGHVMFMHKSYTFKRKEHMGLLYNHIIV